jgi:hypothetical protein
MEGQAYIYNEVPEFEGISSWLCAEREGTPMGDTPAAR